MTTPERKAAPSAPIRVVVVDDQELFVYGMRMLIESQPDLDFAGSSTDGAEAVRLVAETRPDVVLMDIRMPVMNGIEATHRITCAAGRGEGPRVVVLTTFQQEEAVFQSMKHGASAFVTKDATPELLLETIRSVHAGDAPPSELAELVKRYVAPAEVAAPEESIAGLTPREREIFLLAAKGLRNSEIAAAAFVSEATVKTHIRSILAKLGLETRAQIVVHAYENRLLSF
ncbi:response regulator [Herbiconiux sp. P16]|uniref:response regulator transcription factor n=1 Tax=Herbiconiux wuyangfengii TaxID=3342794 RepID=UPI0035B7D304